MRTSIGGNAKQNFNGRNAGKASIAEIRPTDPNWLTKHFQQNIQRASGNVVVEYGGKQYALVADYNFITNDMHWGNDDLLGKQIGGKIGIIEDPFGKNGAPQYLGATTPIVGGAVEHLSLSADGKLYADVLMHDQIRDGIWYTFKSLFVWDAAELVKNALEAKALGQKLTTPIDRRLGNIGVQIPLATPKRIDGTIEKPYFGWTYGIGTYSVPGRTQQLTVAPTMEKPTVPPAPSIDANFLTDYYGISDSAVAELIGSGKKSEWYSAAWYAAKYTAYTAANFMVNGAIDRSAHLTENFVDEKLPFTQYALSMTSTVGYGLTAMVAAGRVATGVSKSVGMGLWGEAAGAVAGDVAYTFLQKGGDIVTYQLSDGKAGQSLQSLKDNWTQVTTDVALGAGLGMLPGLTGRIPYLNGKIMWNSPSVENSLRIRLVQPVMAADARGYRFSLADSTGGDILAAAGGRIMRDGHTLNIPAKGSMTFEESELFLDEASAVMRALLDDKASLREQAFQAAQISNSLVMAARNGLQDANLAAHLNFILPPTTYKQMVEKYSKSTGVSQGHGSDALYEKIIQDAQDQLHRLSCFVAGTLVHTQEGLRPIEQIKVGDYVLSKPESGEGEASYKRVVKTFENGEKEVWCIHYYVSGQPHTEEFVIATTDHPFKVKNIHFLYWEDRGLSDIENTWVRAADLYAHQENGGTITFELADGREAVCSGIGPMLASELPNLGVVFSVGSVGEGNEGIGIDFSKNCPLSLRQADGSLSSIFAEFDDSQPYDQLESDAVANITDGYVPLLRKVYNLEVEENHTYFVGELGVLVHNTCKNEIQPVHKINPEANPADPLGVYTETTATKDLTAKLKEWGDRGLAVIRDIKLGDGWGSKWQALFDGAVFDGMIGDSTTNRLMAYALGYTNSINRSITGAGTTGHNFISIGDALAHIYQNGKRIATSIFVDTKAGAFGNNSVLMQKYVNGMDLSGKDIADLKELVKSLQQRSLALEQYNNLGLVYAPQKNTPYIDSNTGMPIDGGIELFTKFLNKVLKNEGIDFRAVPEGKMGVPENIDWSFDNWFSSKIMIADHVPITVDGKTRYELADKITVFEKQFTEVIGADGSVKQVLSGVVAKQVDSSKILIPADQTAQANAITKLKEKLTELGKSNLLVNEAGSNITGNTLTQADLAQLLPAAKQHWLAAGASAYVLDAVQVSIADLPNGIAGQTQGNQITLDANGAGWGWFVDATPIAAEEFAASDTTTWQATPDSIASGKLDLLGVLIHELGHSLGLAHDTNGAMESIVQTGQRQLPSAAEVALVQGIHQAISAKALGGQIFQTRVTQYAVAANDTLTNGNLNAADGWSTQGAVDIGNGAATMREVPTTQTRLSQVFQLNPTDRFLSFTLSGAVLDDMSGVPLGKAQRAQPKLLHPSPRGHMKRAHPTFFIPHLVEKRMDRASTRCEWRRLPIHAPSRDAALKNYNPNSPHIASTLAFTASSITIGVPHSRWVSPGHLLVASKPILPPKPDTGLAKSR